MGVPFEALIPYGIMVTLFAVSGGAMSKIRHMQNGGKNGRRGLDAWDHQMMDRDRRLTGYFRGQSDTPIAPKDFDITSEWKLERSTF